MEHIRTGQDRTEQRVDRKSRVGIKIKNSMRWVGIEGLKVSVRTMWLGGRTGHGRVMLRGRVRACEGVLYGVSVSVGVGVVVVWVVVVSVSIFVREGWWLL